MDLVACNHKAQAETPRPVGSKIDYKLSTKQAPYPYNKIRNFDPVTAEEGNTIWRCS